MYTKFVAIGAFVATEAFLLRRGNYSAALSLGALVYTSADTIDSKINYYFP